jgi:hypothetical protein
MLHRLVDAVGCVVQHLWNREWQYRACAHCMRSTETADEMAARLSDGHASATDTMQQIRCNTKHAPP